MLFAELDGAQCCAERARFGFIADPRVQTLKEKATPSVLEKYLHVLGSKMTRPFSIASTIRSSRKTHKNLSPSKPSVSLRPRFSLDKCELSTRSTIPSLIGR